MKNENKVNQKIVSVDYLKTLHKENSWFTAKYLKTANK